MLNKLQKAKLGFERRPTKGDTVTLDKRVFTFDGKTEKRSIAKTLRAYFKQYGFKIVDVSKRDRAGQVRRVRLWVSR